MGRPQAILDWEEIDRLLVTGCSGIEIAGSLGIHQNTIYDHCVKEFGISFTEYSNQKYAKGDSILREVQFKNAVNGNTTMQIWLGKQRLKQKENVEEPAQASPELLAAFEAFMRQMASLSTLNKADSNIISDDKS